MNSIVSLLVAVMLVGSGQVSSVKGAVSDSALTARIETTFLLNDHLSPFNINTTTQDSVVMLTGGVRTQIQKDLAGELAASYEGVSQVDNKITVVPTVESSIPKRNFRTKLADKSLSASVRTRLLYRKNLRGLKVKVQTINSVVTITGLVNTKFQREEIEYVAFQTKGVEKVVNQLTIRDRQEFTEDGEVERKFSDEFIEKRVEKSILLNRHLSVRHVDVEVDGGICYLTGTVQTTPEKQLAGSIAYNTGGVQEVRNMIQVRSDINVDEGYLDVLEPLDAPDFELLAPTQSSQSPSVSELPPAQSGDTPLFSDGATIE